jgi:hypothetical protein
MFLFEVREHVEDGFKLVRRGNEAMVALGYDTAAKGPVFLPIGNSIERELRHPDDYNLPFRLLQGKFEEKGVGTVLTAQTREEALKEGKALVLVEACCDPELGVTNVAEAYGKSKPELFSYTEDGSMIRRLLIFKPGDAVFISWSARSLGTERPKRFIIAWDGAQLTEQAVGRPRRNSRPPKKVREQKKSRPMAAPELRPS